MQSAIDPAARRCRYVLPNTSEMNRGGRGSILQRLDLARGTGCDFIEVPADFVKNPTEIRLTGLPFGSMLDAKAISILYRAESVPASAAVVLHTEPELTIPQLRWHDGAWIDAFVAMQIALVEHLGVVPAAVEIHPGIGRSIRVDDIIVGARALIDAFGNRFGRSPLIMLENRTSHVVSDGDDLVSLWRAVEKCEAGVVQQFGVVLDIQQLFTQTSARGRAPERFLGSFAAIPNEALRAFHIHHRHGVPSLGDPIPWRTVFRRIRQVPNVLINPEIHHRKSIPAAKEFCERLWCAEDADTTSPE